MKKADIFYTEYKQKLDDRLIPYLTEEGKKIIGKTLNVGTHNGNHHTDEMISIALLSLLAVDIRVMRTRDKSLLSRNDFILDVGRKYNPDLGLFDHHQDIGSPATNVLITEYLFKGKLLDQLLPFMDEISDRDRGITKDIKRTSLNSMVNSLKELDKPIKKTLDLLRTILLGELLTCLKAIESEEVWNSMESIGKIKYSKKPIEPIINWKNLANRDGIAFQVINGGNKTLVISSDEVKFPIEEHKNQTFLHGTKWFAKYKSFDVALNHVKSLLKEKVDI